MAWDSWADHHAQARLWVLLSSPPTGEIETGSCWLLAETLYQDGLQAQLVGDGDRVADSLDGQRGS